jgi:branched-chain amino acid transport system permease protein
LAVFDIPVQLWTLQIFTGLALGSVLVLLAVGLSLIFGMLAVVNFAHGAFYMVGAYAGVFVFGLTGNFWLGLVGVPLIVGTIGLAVERVLIRPLYGRGIDYPLLLTFGLSYVFIDVIKMVFGKIGLPFSAPAMLQGAVNIGIGYFPLYRLFLIGAMTVMVTGLWLFLEKTSYGLVIRAGARDSEIVRVLGIDISRVWMVVFGIGTAAAGIAGYLSAPMQSVIPEMGIPVLVQAFVVTVVGGMGSLVGAVIAGLLVGVVTSITVMIAPQLADAAMFGLMAVVLLLRPQGLFGRRGLME